MTTIDLGDLKEVSIYRNGKLIYTDDPMTDGRVTIFSTSQYKNEKYGTISLEEWPEGLILWIGGKIKWQGWK